MRVEGRLVVSLGLLGSSRRRGSSGLLSLLGGLLSLLDELLELAGRGEAGILGRGDRASKVRSKRTHKTAETSKVKSPVVSPPLRGRAELESWTHDLETISPVTGSLCRLAPSAAATWAGSDMASLNWR